MIDELDKKILNMLIANGRQSSREITKKLSEEGIKISERGLGKRMARLERNKIITGYTAIVDMKRVNMGIPRLVTVKLSSPKDFVQRLSDMKEYLADAPFCDFSARSNGRFDWIELKFFNNLEQANAEADLYRTWFGDIIEGPETHGVHGGIEVTMARDHDKGEFGLYLSGGFQDLDPVHLGHFYIA